MNNNISSLNCKTVDRDGIKSAFSIFIAFYPVLCVYKAFFKFTIGDIILIVFLFLSVIKKKKRSFKIVSVFLAFVIYVTFSFFIMNLIYENPIFNAIVFRYIKLMFYIFSVIYVSHDFIDTDILKKWIIRVSVTSCVYIYIQYIMYYGYDKILNGWLKWIPIYIDQYAELDYAKFYTIQFRPTSFFLEPALFCQYIIVALIFLLTTNQKKLTFKNILCIGIILSGIILSTSGQGILFATIVVIIYIMTIVKNKAKSIVLLMAGIGLSFLLYNSSEIFFQSVNRLFFNSGAFEARLGSFKYIFDLKGAFWLFGYGYGTTPYNTYLVGGAYVWYGCGIIGLLLAIFMFYKTFRVASCSTAKIIAFIFFIMFFGTSLFYNYMFFWYFSLALYVNVINKKIDASHNLI